MKSTTMEKKYSNQMNLCVRNFNEPYHRKRLQTRKQASNEWFENPGSDQFQCGFGQQKQSKSREPLIWISLPQWFGRHVRAL